VSNSYNRLFQSKFRGCTQIGYVNRDDNKVHLRVFKLPDTESLVGIYDGIDCWVANPKYCLHGMKQGTDPARPESHLASPRKRINVVATTTGRIRAKLVMNNSSNTPKPRRQLNVTN